MPISSLPQDHYARFYVPLGVIWGFSKKGILYKFYREKAGNLVEKINAGKFSEKHFMEYVLIENARALLQMRPVKSFLYLQNREELRDILSLKRLETYERWRDSDMKRKYFKRDFGTRIICLTSIIRSSL